MKKRLSQDEFYQYKFLGGLQASPSRKKVAFCAASVNEKKSDYDRHLWLYDGEEVKPLTGGISAGPYCFEDEDTILFASPRGEEKNSMKTEFYRISLQGGEAQKAFAIPLQVESIHKYTSFYLIQAHVLVNYFDYYKMKDEDQKQVEEEIKKNEDYEVVDEYPFFFNGAGFINKTRSAIFLMDSKSHALTPIGPKTMNFGSFEVREDEKKILYTGTNFKSVMGFWEQVYEYDIKSKKTVQLFGGKTMSISHAYYKANGSIGCIASDKNGVVGMSTNPEFYEIKKGALVKTIKNDTSLYNSVGSDCRLVGGTSFRNLKGKVYSLNTIGSNSELWTAKGGKFIPLLTLNGSVDDFDFGPDGKIYFIAMMKQKLQELYVYDGKTIETISHLNDKVLEDKYVAKPKPVTCHKKELDVYGWVLEPYNYNPKKKYPAILDIHGGPKGVYGEVFYHEMQYWANKGYFVFFCNPRGGDGRGNDFCDLNFKHQWGTVDYEDIMDFTDTVLAKYKAIDPKRVGVTGGSYGGYMTNWIIGHTNRFCCAAPQRSISNWMSEVLASDCGIDFAIDFKRSAKGRNLAEGIWNISPLKYAEKIKTPTLFIHSFEDYRCPYPEGIQLYTAIRNRGVEARMCLFKGENHELSRGGKPLHRSRRLYEITDWMDRFTKNKVK